MILFYKAGEDKKPIVYKGLRDKADKLIKFIKQHQAEVKVQKLKAPEVTPLIMIVYWLGLLCKR